jgi:hypothetical protein
MTGQYLAGQQSSNTGIAFERKAFAVDERRKHDLPPLEEFSKHDARFARLPAEHRAPLVQALARLALDSAPIVTDDRRASASDATRAASAWRRSSAAFSRATIVGANPQLRWRRRIARPEPLTVAVLCALTLTVFAQQPLPQFEVASVRPSTNESGPPTFSAPSRGTTTITNGALRDIIPAAFGIPRIQTPFRICCCHCVAFKAKESA